jgi:hypothetical protein
LTAMIIYPNHSVGDRSGLRRAEASAIPTQLVSSGYYALQSSLFELRLDTLLTSATR